jgi:hypothetical protein
LLRLVSGERDVASYVSKDKVALDHESRMTAQRWGRKSEAEGRRPTSASGLKMKFMANLTLVYGMRLLPSEEVSEVGDATLKLKNGREAHVTMHVLEGSKEEIEKQLKTSLEAFFDFYPEI